MATFHKTKWFFFVCFFIDIATSSSTQPKDSELVQFQLDRFQSHNQLEFYFSGEHYKVQLVANHDLIHDESAPICHYFGFVLEPTKYANSSNLALSLCPNRGIRGSITTHDLTLSIIPSLESSSNNHQLTDDHLVSKQWIQRTRKHLSRHLLRSSDRIKIELYVLSDPAYTQMYKDKYGFRWKDELKYGVKDLVNDASAEYSWWDWGEIGQITLNIITLEIMEEFNGIYTNLRPKFAENTGLKRTCRSTEHWSNKDCRYDGYDYLPKFRTFTTENNRYGDTRVILSGTGMNGINGLADVASVCKSYSAALVSNPIYNSRIKTFAHEIGHNLGMRHYSVVGVMGARPSNEEIQKKSKVVDPITGAETRDQRKYGWSQQSKNALSAYSKKDVFSCTKDGVRSFKVIHTWNKESSSSTNTGSSGACVEIRSLSSSLDGEWKADGAQNGKKKYKNPNSRGSKWLYWTGKYWTMNNDYQSGVNVDAYCLEAKITDCDALWVSYGYKSKNSRFADCGSFSTNEEGLECLEGNQYEDSVCVYVDGYKEFKIANECYNDKPVYEYASDDISYHLYSSVYYEFFGNHSNATVDEWIISLYEVASRDIVAKCDESDLLECLHEKWQVEYTDNDTIAMIVDETINVQNGKCVTSTLSSTSASTVVIVWICIAFGFVLLLSIFALFIYRRSKQSKQVAIGDESEDEEVEDEEEIEVEVDTKLTETR